MLKDVRWKLIPPTIRKGNPSAMMVRAAEPYWSVAGVPSGSLVAGESPDCLELTPKERAIFGIDDPGPKTAEAREVQRAVDDNMGDLNARQICARLRAGNDALVNPPEAQPVAGTPPDKINLYTDGGVLFPNRQDLAVGGFGVWVPKGAAEEDEHDNIVQGTADLMIWEKVEPRNRNVGTHVWGVV